MIKCLAGWVGGRTAIFKKDAIRYCLDSKTVRLLPVNSSLPCVFTADSCCRDTPVSEATRHRASVSVTVFGVILHCARRGLHKNIVSTTAPERAVSLRIVTRCRFMNWPIRCERGGRNVHFLSINLVSFCWSCGIVLVMAFPGAGDGQHR